MQLIGRRSQSITINFGRAYVSAIGASTLHFVNEGCMIYLGRWLGCGPLEYCSPSLVWHVWETHRKVVLPRCCLLIYIRNGVKLLYYWGEYENISYIYIYTYNEFKQYRWYEIITYNLQTSTNILKNSWNRSPKISCVAYSS